MEQVLYKEALASVFEGAIKQTYEVADQECRATEHRSMIQAAKKSGGDMYVVSIFNCIRNYLLK